MLDEEKYGIKQALKVIATLLDSGALVDKACGDVLILNTVYYDWILFSKECPESLPVHLALFLKKHEDNGSNKYMDIAINLLQDASKKTKEQPSSFKTTTVLKSVANRYKSMLFSEDFSDVVFQCSDGVSVPAHKMILAFSSPYFKAAFQGDWSENNSDVIWKTAHSSSLIKSVLTLIYTGSVEECEKLLNDKGIDPLVLLDLACEYDIEPLIHICVDNCIRKLKLTSVRCCNLLICISATH